MTPAPWGVVLVPTEAGLALTAKGRCCAFPPLVIRGWALSGWLVASAEHRREPAPDDEVSALPLWWDHAIVPEGLDRLHRVMQHEQWSRHPTAQAVLQMARQAEYDGLCRVVVLDLVDGAVRERAT